MAKIVKQFTKFIFPFQFDKEQIIPRTAQTQNKKGVFFNVFEQFTQPTESLREGLELLLSERGGKSKIGECYKLSINCRKEFSLPPRKEELLSFVYRQSGGDVAKVAITEVKFYFFESQIGFAEVECAYESDDIDEYIALNYFISEVKSDKNEFIYHEKVWNEETRQSTIEDRKFLMIDLLKQLARKASKKENAIEFINENAKPMVYSYLLVDEKPADMPVLLQYLAKNYKQSYKFEASCVKTQQLHPFENSYWTGSLNGAMNLSYLTGDAITDHFFLDDFYVKAKNTYYFLFLNILHQRYAINKVMGEMGKLDSLSNDYYVMENQLKEARRCEAEAINLKFRAFFKCPSFVEHVNEYYDMLYRAFEVGAMYDNFSTDIASLQNICSAYVQRIKAREEKFKKRKDAKVEIFVSIFGAIVAEVTLFNNSWAVVEKVLGRSISFWSPGILILLATLISPLITIFINVAKKRAEIKELTQQINGEMEDKLVEDDKKRKKKGRLVQKLKKIKKKEKKQG